MKYLKKSLELNEAKNLVYYHGTDAIFKRGDDLKLPLWVTPDINLAKHFCAISC
jgi:hypothetical protein